MFIVELNKNETSLNFWIMIRILDEASKFLIVDKKSMS